MTATPNKSLVEAVAKAISRWMNGSRLPSPPIWDRLQESTRQAYREQAEAAIDACHACEMAAIRRRLTAPYTGNPDDESLEAIQNDAAALLAKLDGNNGVLTAVYTAPFALSAEAMAGASLTDANPEDYGMKLVAGKPSGGAV